MNATAQTTLDPFALTQEAYLALNKDEQRALTEKLYARYATTLQQQFRQNGTALLVICDGQIIYASTDRYDFHADEVVLQTEQARNKPCFIFTSPPLIEEIATWSDLGQGDHYPTIELFLGARGWGESDVFNHGVPVVSDFDTGNAASAIFDETLCYQLSGVSVLYAKPYIWGVSMITGHA